MLTLLVKRVKKGRKQIALLYFMVWNFSAFTGKWGPVLQRSPENQTSREGCKGPTFFPAQSPYFRETITFLSPPQTPGPAAEPRCPGSPKSPSTRIAAIIHLPAVQLNPSVPHLTLQQVLRDTCCWPQGATG